MSRVSIEIDEEACAFVMQRFGCATKSDAVNFALRRLAPVPMGHAEALAMRGTGWHGDLAQMRGDQSP